MARVTATLCADGIAMLEMMDAVGRNAMSEPFVAELLDAFKRVVEWPDLKVAVLFGLTDVFSAGASPEVLRSLADGAIAPSDVLLGKVFLDFPVPTIAAMEGHAIGGGLALGVCADIVLVARESRYGCPFMDLGFTPGMGLTRLLEHALSPAIAHEMLFSGEAFKGAHFERRGGFNYILSKAEVRPKALDLAQRIAEKPMVALRALKQTLALPKRQAFAAAYVAETLMHQITFAQPGLRQHIEEGYVA
jgi:4-carboxy-3-alkylbut-2-enoyl-[acp] decarboxylase